MRDLCQSCTVLTVDQTLRDAVTALLDSDLPALPVADARGRYAGVFGEREFLEAVLPGYFKDLKFTAFLTEAVDRALEHRADWEDLPLDEYLNREHVEAGADASDAQIAETFLHHRVLIVPIIDDGRVVGVVRRRDYFQRLARRLLDLPR